MAPSVETELLPLRSASTKAPANLGVKPEKENPNLKGGRQAYELEPPVFENPYEERVYLKQRLALAFRIFSKFGTVSLGHGM